MDSGLACFVILFVIVLVTLIAIMGDRENREKALKQARLKYQEALNQLKSDPANPDLRQKALELGRQYSFVTRQRQGVTVFDEVALMNDINAATAGAVSPSQPGQDRSNQQSIDERLAKLSELKSKGLIDEQEYTAKRKQILDEI